MAVKRRESIINRRLVYEEQRKLAVKEVEFGAKFLRVRREERQRVRQEEKQRENKGNPLHNYGLRRYTVAVCDNIIKKFIDSGSKLSNVKLTDNNYKDHNLSRHIKRRINDLELNKNIKIYTVDGEIYLKLIDGKEKKENG